jgi:hypothetical protein
MLATKLTLTQAEYVRRTQRCPYCKGSLLIQADPDVDFREADLVCATGCARVAARIELIPRPVLNIEKARRGRPPIYALGQPQCLKCGGALTHEQRVRHNKYCSHSCSAAHARSAQR